MLSFDGKSWDERIAAKTGQRKYQQATVELVDPKLVDTEYDIETGWSAPTNNGIIYEGQARVIAVRRGTNYEGSLQGNSKTITSVRVQLPGDSLPQTVRKGVKMRVTDSPRNRTLEGYVYTLASDFHGSSAATRTLEFNLDGDSTHG